jgi:glycosyltransferase involved in cell wall biosynthesis
MKKLRIGQIGPLNVPIPPEKYGGTERIVDALCRGLSRQGHEVFLFAAGDAKTGGKLIPIVQKSLWNNEIQETTPYYSYEMAIVAKEAARLKLDVIHDHVGPFSLSLYGCPNIPPILHTLHVPLNKNRAWAYEKLNSKLISISNNQRKDAPELNYVATIYNGVNSTFFKFNRETKNYFLFLGELVERKGVREAIMVAKILGIKLLIAGRVPLQTPSQIKDYLFFKKYVKPELGHNNIEYVGEVGQEKTVELYGQAKATLFPICWEEPFGLVMTESMACGTPVIAFRRGSVPEVIKDGVTGFICKPGDLDDMAKMVNKINDMPTVEYLKMRENCRKHVEENFTIEKMVDGYGATYKKILGIN